MKTISINLMHMMKAVTSSIVTNNDAIDGLLFKTWAAAPPPAWLGLLATIFIFCLYVVVFPFSKASKRSANYRIKIVGKDKEKPKVKKNPALKPARKTTHKKSRSVQRTK